MKFNSEAFIKEMESIPGVEDTLMNYEEYEEYQEQISERELRGGM